MREVEVLRDYLLRRFKEDSSLEPKDVLVMIPNPEEYTPYIRAVFSGMEEECPGNFHTQSLTANHEWKVR